MIYCIGANFRGMYISRIRNLAVHVIRDFIFVNWPVLTIF